MPTLKEQIDKAENVVNEPIVDIIKYHNVHIFITEGGSAVLLESDDLPNAIFARVVDAERNIDEEARMRK